MTTTTEVSSIVEPLSESELCPDALLAGQEAAFARDVERLQQQRDRFVEVVCPACDNSDTEPAFEKLGFAYVTCRTCGTLFMSPRPSEPVMAAYYAGSENYRYWAKRIFPASEATRRRKLHEPWLARVLDYARRHGISTGRLVEAGGGFGTFAAVARASERFDEVVVVEPTPEMAAACRARGVTVVQRRFEEVDDEVAPAEVLVGFEVIEHIFQPKRFVAQCHRLLRGGGLLVLSCPNGEGFDIRMLGPASLAVDPEHVNLFNPRSLRRLVESHGFEVLEISTPGRLDVEFVHRAIRDGVVPAPHDPFLRRVLVDEYEHLSDPFQRFLADNGLSSHMWMAARKR